MGILHNRFVKAFLRKANIGTTELFVNFDSVLANAEQSSPSLKAKLAQTPESFFIWVQKVTQFKNQKMHIFGSTPMPIEYRDFYVTSDMPSIEISSALQLEAPDFATVNVVLVGEPQSHLNAIKATMHPKGINVTNLEIDGFIDDFKKSTETTNEKIHSFYDISDDVKKEIRLSIEKTSQYGTSKILLSYAAMLVIKHWPNIVEKRSKSSRLAGLKAKEFFQKLYPNYKISPCGLYIEKKSLNEGAVTRSEQQDLRDKTLENLTTTFSKKKKGLIRTLMKHKGFSHLSSHQICFLLRESRNSLGNLKPTRTTNKPDTADLEFLNDWNIY